ncbi:MAG: hypothetical protein QOE47_2779 [Pyrinomonadaceae bacterium]|nr:hypothetical protein [Pyrinomonadaceae bacterium]
MRAPVDLMPNRRDSNRLLVRHLLLPTIFLTVALAGGLRVAAATGAFLFVAPPLVALVLAVLLMLLFARGRLVDLGAWLSGDHAPLTVVSHALTLIALFFASAQAFNSVLPDVGLFRWMFAFFFLWTLWNNQFAAFDARRLLRSLAALFGTAFVLKHMLLASLYSTDGGWLKRLAGALLEGFTQGTLTGTQETFAPATGYISFFTLALYVLGLVLLPSAPETDDHAASEPESLSLVTQYRRLSPEERALLREEILRTERGRLEDEIHATRTD